MKNIIEINGHKALVSFDPQIEMLRGEFLGLSGGADFYSANVVELEAEGARSLAVYLKLCRERRIKPFETFGRDSISD